MQLDKIFSSNMVFPKGKEIWFYGTGKGNVKITFDGEQKTAVSCGDEWKICFSPRDFGGPYSAVIRMDNETVELQNIYVELVFLMAGQSNMQFKLKESTEKHYISNPLVRLFSTYRIEDTDCFHSADGWVVCDEKTAGEWSAIAYYVGNMVSEKLNVAVGLISCYQGASVIESWLPEGTLEKNGIAVTDSGKHPDHFCDLYSAWNSDGTLYEKVFKQILPFSVSAVVWYQGESDASDGEAPFYRDELKLLIDTWRKDLGDASLPFVIVQIAEHSGKGESWRVIQKAQYEIQHEVNDVKTVISADVCEKDVIHPPTKDRLSKRIADALRGMIKI